MPTFHTFHTFYLRTGSTQQFIPDAFEVVEDPIAAGLVREAPQDFEFEYEAGPRVDVIGEGRWIAEEGTYEDGEQVEPPVMGDHALVNVLLREGRDDDLIAAIEAMEKADSSLHPDEVDDALKLPNGTHRITEPSLKVRSFA
jgi:hypothetical protein